MVLYVALLLHMPIKCTDMLYALVSLRTMSGSFFLAPIGLHKLAKLTLPLGPAAAVALVLCCSCSQMVDTLAFLANWAGV